MKGEPRTAGQSRLWQLEIFALGTVNIFIQARWTALDWEKKVYRQRWRKRRDTYVGENRGIGKGKKKRSSRGSDQNPLSGMRAMLPR